jgi:hypothetical protein
MEQYTEIIVNKYRVEGIENLLELHEEDIELWKDIPLGFRIKIKKIIKEHRKNKGGSPNKDEFVGGEDI